jgi:hypothetical protein
MPMALNARVILAGVMSAIFAAMVGMALSYPVDAAFVPLVIGIPGTVLCLIQLATELRAARSPAAAAPGPVRDVRQEWIMYGWLVSFVASVVLLGFLVAAPLVLYAYLRFKAKAARWLAVVIALAGLALIYGVFDYTLGVTLWEGFLTPIVTGWLGLS